MLHQIDNLLSKYIVNIYNRKDKIKIFTKTYNI